MVAGRAVLRPHHTSSLPEEYFILIRATACRECVYTYRERERQSRARVLRVYRARIRRAERVRERQELLPNQPRAVDDDFCARFVV